MITDIEIVRVDPDGCGYAVIYTDTGESFGQNFKHAPIGDHAAFCSFTASMAQEAHDRIYPAPQAQIDKAVESMQGTKVSMEQIETMETPGVVKGVAG